MCMDAKERVSIFSDKLAYCCPGEERKRHNGRYFKKILDSIFYDIEKKLAEQCFIDAYSSGTAAFMGECK